jgi:hypothetical protein
MKAKGATPGAKTRAWGFGSAVMATGQDGTCAAAPVITLSWRQMAAHQRQALTANCGSILNSGVAPPAPVATR